MPVGPLVYQEVIYEVRPDIIIECGTYEGGSAAFLASISDLLKRGRVITIDIEARDTRPKHKRVKYILGSSTAPRTLELVKREVKPSDRVLVLLDSDHSKEHVLNEMRSYSPLVTVGSYLIVEDTNINGNPVYPDFGPGPMEAIQEFLNDRRDFEVDSAARSSSSPSTPAAGYGTSRRLFRRCFVATAPGVISPLDLLLQSGTL